MKEAFDMLKELHLGNNIELDDIPSIDLYMDQVIQLFENKLKGSKRNEDDKILTKTMINNYSKGKLLMPIKNKKYSKEHIILMSFIYELKGILSIADIKKVLEIIVENYDKETYDIENLYEIYLELFKNNVELFSKDIETEFNRSVLKDKNLTKEEENILTICSLINKSNMYRRLAEKLIDSIENSQG